MNLRPLPPQDAPSSKIAFFDYFCVLYSPKTVLSCALTHTVSAQSKPNYGQTCGQNRAGRERKIFTAKRGANNGKINTVFITRVTNKCSTGYNIFVTPYMDGDKMCPQVKSQNFICNRQRKRPQTVWCIVTLFLLKVKYYFFFSASGQISNFDTL